MKMLVFGGKNLPDGSHTFYTKKAGGEFRADVGHEVAFDEVENAQQFIDSKRASVKDAKPAPASPGA